MHGRRTFLHQFIDCINNSSSRPITHTFSHNSMQILLYLWWKNFLVTCNGQSMMLDFRQPGYVQTDMSFLGFGAICLDDWFAGSWSECLVSNFCNSYPHSAHCSHAGHTIDPSLCSNINYLELFPLLIAVCHWGTWQLDKHVVVKTDNTQAMAFINNGTCTNLITMSWLHEIFWIIVQYNFQLWSQHLPN